MTALSLFELGILDGFQNISNALFDFISTILNYASAHGEIFMVFTLGLLIYKPTRKVGYVCVTALAFDVLLVNVAIKPLVERIRPFDLNPLIELIVKAPSDYSFPSGHTAVAFAFATAVSPLGKKAHTLALAFASIMGLSRLYLYVHYPTDVIFGALFGTLCGLMALYIWKKLDQRDIM